MAKKTITIDELAVLMQKGFEKADKKIENLAVAMQKGFVKIEQDTDKKIDDLAIMVQKGFNDITEKMATKEDLNQLRSEMNKRFDKIENVTLAKHETRIEKLENDVKELKELKEMFAV